MHKLRILQSQIDNAVMKLIDERDAAERLGNAAAANAAREEARRLNQLSQSVQFLINRNVAADLGKIADVLEQSIREQRVFGLRAAAEILVQAVKDLTGRQVELPPEPRVDEPEPSGGEPEEPAQPARPAGATVRARPGPHQEVVDAIIREASRAGLDPVAVLAIVAIESDFRPTVCNPVTSAAGLFQFIDGTWVAEGGTEFAGRGGKGNGHAAGASVAVQAEIGCAFTAKNQASLRKLLGRNPSPGELYMAHQQGLGGAREILRAALADPDAPITAAISESAARNNRLDGLTVTQAIRKFQTMMRAHIDEVMALVEPVEVPAPIAEALAPRSDRRVAMKAVEVALNEMELFARRGGRALAETEEPLSSRVLHYFGLVGRPDIRRADVEPWSAAFISFCMREAGATAEQFPIGSAAHADYIHKGVRSRSEDDPVVYFDRDDCAPRIGDLVGFSRDENVKNRHDIEALNGKFFGSHTDLVLDVAPGSLTVIGGNKSHTIKTEKIRTDEQGRMVSDKYFFVLKINV